MTTAVATAYKRGRKNERMEQYQQPDGERERGVVEGGLKRECCMYQLWYYAGAQKFYILIVFQLALPDQTEEIYHPTFICVSVGPARSD